MKKEKILLISQYFPPDLAGTGIVMEELAEDLQANFDVTVLAGRTFFYNLQKYKYYKSKVRVKRIRHPHWNKNTFLGRMFNFIFFPSSVLLHPILLSKANKIILVSNPSTILIVGIFAHIFLRKKIYYIWQDMYPDLPISLGAVSASSLLSRMMRRLNIWGFKHVEKIILLSRSMREYFAKAYPPWLEKTTVITNWADTTKNYPQNKDNAWSRVSGYLKYFVVLYSGNIGQAYNFKPIMDAAEIFKNEKNVVFLFAGEGAQKPQIEKIKNEKNLTNVDFMSYVPTEDYNKLLATADCHIVSLKEQVDNFSFPGKIYNSMAAGRPIIAISDPLSSLTKLVNENNLGFSVTNGVDLSKAILAIKNDKNLFEDFCRNSRNLALRSFSREDVTKQYTELLKN